MMEGKKERNINVPSTNSFNDNAVGKTKMLWLLCLVVREVGTLWIQCDVVCSHTLFSATKQKETE